VSVAYNLLPYNDRNPSLDNFVFGTFADSLKCWPWNAIPIEVLKTRLKNELMHPGTVTVIADTPSEPGRYIGWYAYRKENASIIYGFTKYNRRRLGVATAIFNELGMGKTAWVTFWTPACSRIAGKGKHLVFDTRMAWDA
jgi:hypothetical protein